jgi:hypothetical protein
VISMFDDAPNPTQVQFLEPSESTGDSRLPLVLIHDGGGTTFNYFILGSLYRDVWAIHDPLFQDGTLWEGGIDAMARHYIDLMRKEGIEGPILLGGKCSEFIFRWLSRKDKRNLLKEAEVGTNTLVVSRLVIWWLRGA